MSETSNEKWQKIRQVLGYCLLGGALLVGGLCAWLWGGLAALVGVLALLCLALGFWVTESLIGALTGVKKLSPLTLLLLVMAKFSWWTGLFLLPKFVPHGLEKAVGVGMGVFLLAIVVAGLSQYGIPRISDGKS